MACFAALKSRAQGGLGGAQRAAFAATMAAGSALVVLVVAQSVQDILNPEKGAGALGVAARALAAWRA